MKTEIKYSSPISASLNMLDSIKKLLDKIPLEIYTEANEILSGATLGQHFRHIIEFYQCILDGSKNSMICYDNRTRDLRLEDNINFMSMRIDRLSEALKHVDADSPIQTISKFTSDPKEEQTNILSSLGRELSYGFDHSIHHLAIVKIALKISHPQIELPTDLGVAPSTLQYKNTCAH